MKIYVLPNCPACQIAKNDNPDAEILVIGKDVTFEFIKQSFPDCRKTPIFDMTDEDMNFTNEDMNFTDEDKENENDT